MDRLAVLLIEVGYPLDPCIIEDSHLKQGNRPSKDLLNVGNSHIAEAFSSGSSQVSSEKASMITDMLADAL